MFFFKDFKSINEKINLPVLNKQKISLYIKREDLIHPIISGNKFRKLKYNIKEAINQQKSEILTFGGAYSNHLLACSFIGKLMKLKTTGIIRGDELSKQKLNSTLQKCHDFGMKFIFISREEYKRRNEKDYISSLKKLYRDAFIIPEGGTNDFGIMGCQEILNKEDETFDVICCPVGSGGTISGLINSKKKHQKILGFSALKSSEINNVISKFVNNNNWKVLDDIYFGGYSKIDNKLVNFINKTYSQTGILFDPIYNSKMLFQIIHLILSKKWVYGNKVLLINTGGLQSITEMNIKLNKKGCQVIDY
jgi:1-aminocyclopropane-1-carboxylate deaminase